MADLAAEGHVYWAERGGRKQTIVSLRSAPIDVARRPARAPVWLWRERGLHERDARSCRQHRGVRNPDRRRKCPRRGRAVAVRLRAEHAGLRRGRCALPFAQEAKLSLEALTDYIRFCVVAVQAASLVLFTSYTDMRAVAAALEAEVSVKPAGRF